MIMEVFSWKLVKEKAVKKKVARAIIMANNPVSNDGTINDFSVAHVSEVKDAQMKKYDLLTKRVKEQVLRQQQKAMDSRDKIAGK